MLHDPTPIRNARDARSARNVRSARNISNVRNGRSGFRYAEMGIDGLVGDSQTPGRYAVRGTSIGGVIVVIWLIIGAIAAGQRGYFNSGSESCNKASTTAVTVVAGPLNYVGVNPKVRCSAAPQPSR